MLISCENERLHGTMGAKMTPKSFKWREKCPQNLVQGIPSETNASNILSGTPLGTILVDFEQILNDYWQVIGVISKLIIGSQLWVS